MADKTFVVSHRRARSPITITGHTLKQALKKEGLDPNIWKETAQDHKVSEPEYGDNQGDARPEDN